MDSRYPKIDKLLHNAKFMQFVRFVLNGGLSAAIHYAIYYLLLFFFAANAAYIAGYLISFVNNFFLTCYFTFRKKPSWKRFIGFSGSHALNFGLHVVLFNIFLWMGVHKLIIPFFVMGIAMIVQFFVLRFVFVKKS